MIARAPYLFLLLILIPDFGYWLDDNTVVTANNAEVVESNGRMALFVVLSATPVGPYILGDANGDNKIDMRDPTYIRRYCAKIATGLSDSTLMHGDVDNNGRLEILDATYIQMYLADMSVRYRIGELV